MSEAREHSDAPESGHLYTAAEVARLFELP